MNKHIVCPHCLTTNRLPAERLTQGGKCGKCKQPLFSGQATELDSSSFNKHIHNNDIPTVVDFWASWCGPCKMMAPAFAQTAAQLEPNFRFAKVNTETEQQLAMQYGIRSIPTLVVFRDGKEIARQAGAMDSQMLSRWVSQLN